MDMLRRNSSRKQRRPLSRSKSTNSITRPVRFEAIDPATAERDAHIAAVLSYHRAQSRSEMHPIPRDPASFYPDRSDVPSSRSVERSESTSRRGGSESTSGIKRRQSVRFAGPSAPPRRNLASRASETVQYQNGLRVLGLDNRPSSTLSYARQTPDPHGMTRRYLDSLPGCYEDDVALPISHQRLRKSRSMFSTFNALNPGYSFGPEEHHLQKENEPLRTEHPRPATSLSLLKGRRASRSTSRVENDLAVQLARDTYRQQMQEQRLKSRPSTFFGSRSKRSESSMGFRKSLRNSSNNSTVVSAFSTNSISVPKQPGLRKTARKVSRTLRTKLKGLFTRPKSTTTDEVHESDGESEYQPDEPPQEASVLRVRSHVPSLHAVPSSQELKSRKGSVGSIKSEDKSRVTSWTNSETASCVSERRRSAMGTNTFHGRRSDGSPSKTVNSQRVYSALMKRMDQIKQQEATVAQSIASGADWIPSTIRCVQAEDDVFQPTRRSSSSTQTVDKVALAREEPPKDQMPKFERQDQKLTQSRSSTFFASPACHMFRTTSPYRRALRESMRSEQETDSKYLKSLSEISLPTRRTSSAGSEKDAAYAESVYSDDAPEPTLHGSATIFVEKKHRREVSTASSMEWKTWLSAKVSKLEGSGMGSPSTIFRLGHVREGAQIDSPDDSPRVEAKISRTYSSGTVTRDENEAQSEWSDWPPIPPRSRLRTSLDAKTESEPRTPQIRPLNTLGRLESTPEEAMQKRRSRQRTSGWPGSPAKSSPGLSMAVEAQFLKSPRRGLTTSNSTPRSRRFEDDGKRLSQDSDGSLMGSKQMVDMFLDSRRRMDGSGGSSPAFL